MGLTPPANLGKRRVLHDRSNVAGAIIRAQLFDTITERWVGADLPEVIDLRRHLLPDEPMSLHAASLDDPAWAARLPTEDPVLILTEGVIMYLTPDGLTAFLSGA